MRCSRNELSKLLRPLRFQKKPGRQRQGIVETMAKSAARSIGSQIATQLMRGNLGSLLKSKIKAFL
ncbi:hypothetical protein ES702_04622 [subsurface metagenome]